MMFTIGMKPSDSAHYSTAHDVLEEMEMQKWYSCPIHAVKVCREAELMLKGYEFTVFELVEMDIEDRGF